MRLSCRSSGGSPAAVIGVSGSLRVVENRRPRCFDRGRLWPLGGFLRRILTTNLLFTAVFLSIQGETVLRLSLIVSVSPLAPLTSRLHGVSLDSCGGVLDFTVQVLAAGGFPASMILARFLLGVSRVLCFAWLRLDSGHRSSKVCLSGSIARSNFMDYKGYGEEESGKLLAPNWINLGKVVMTKEPGVASTTWLCSSNS
ncbi:hypothetical protein F2Q70_00001274 [Brassica cretica]|uniref:Uncharacterized protein n=1 Tax=Brassica cretica TaxID=69181 RepID=A0A8S9J239_BRACR|nr:hypothetical protein F2Q68_00019418 [Brassica cretica]KAF2575713.1 hypothetical protein F2Q70_00001274 [Brassica cretica]